jgi:hypothetical protein
MVVLIAGMPGCDGYTPPSEDLEIRTWYDLDNVRDNLVGDHILMNDLDSTTPGYEELASSIANGGQGWEPIGDWHTEFNGTFDGQGYEIRDLFIHRPEEDEVGLFGRVDEGGRMKDIGVVSANVTGRLFVGVLVGDNLGHVNSSYSTGSVTGTEVVGGLLGDNSGPVSDSYSIGHVIGDGIVGGLVGGNGGPVSDSYSTGSVTGRQVVGGLLGVNFHATVSNSYFTGSVTGEEIVGGLMGETEDGTVSNSYSTGSVTGTYEVGGLVGGNGGIVSDCHSTGSVTGNERVGGLLGFNTDTVSNSYATGNITGDEDVGGLVGLNKFDGVVSNSFWDMETSGRTYSDGGTGKNTTEMKNITTFAVAGWNIIAVALNYTNPAYIWNIVNNLTYAFLSWQS